MMGNLKAWLLGFADLELAKVNRKLRESESLLEASRLSNREFSSSIRQAQVAGEDKDRRISELEAEVSRLDQTVAIQEDVIAQLRLWHEETTSMLDKRIALHAKAKVVASQTLMPVEGEMDEGL